LERVFGIVLAAENSAAGREDHRAVPTHKGFKSCRTCTIL
jgi:hypothetical protein